VQPPSAQRITSQYMHACFQACELGACRPAALRHVVVWHCMQAASHPPADPDPDIQAVVAAKLLADGEIVQYRVPGGQAADPVKPAAAAAAEAPTSGSLGGGSSSGSGAPTARGKGHDPVLASAAVSEGPTARTTF
jgi:hypothetical protein